MRVLLFIAFLAAYAAYMWAGSALAKRLAHRALLNVELSVLLDIVALFSFVFLLSGYFDALLLLALLAATQLGILMSVILVPLIGSASFEIGTARGELAGVEFAIKHRAMMLGGQAAMALAFIAFPIAIGIAYFDAPAAELPIRVLQYTLCLRVAVYPLIWSFLIGALASRNLDEDARRFFFVNQITGLLPLALYTALTFWSFGIAGTGAELRVGGGTLAFSPLLVAVLLAFFVLVVLLPYLVGGQRARRWRIALLERRGSWLQRIEDVLEKPAGPRYRQELGALQTDLDREITAFTGEDPLIGIGVEIDRGAAPAEIKLVVPAYQLVRELDPRFRHLDALRRISAMNNEIQTDLGKLTNEAELEKSAKAWLSYLLARKAEQKTERRELERTRTPALLTFSGVSAVTGAVIMGVLSEFAKWIWLYFSASLPK